MVYQETLDRTFGALADPTRRAIVDRLAGAEHTISELAEPFDMSLPAVSKHVRVLESAGLLAVERIGRSRHCRLLADPFAEAEAWLKSYRRFWQLRLDALADLVEAAPSTADDSEGDA